MALLPKKLRFWLFDTLSVKTMRYLESVPRHKAQGIVALLAKKARRPVRLAFTREEQAVVGTRRHTWTLKLKVGAKKDGSLMAYESKAYLNAGPIIFLGIIVCMNQAHLTPKFSCPNRKYTAYATYTNSPPASAFRGFGYFDGDFAVGMLMDELFRLARKARPDIVRWASTT